MKSILDIAWNVPESQYRGDNSLSYSTLSQFAREGVACIPHLKDKKDSEALRFGSLTDTIMTEPENFDDKFVVANFSKVSETIVKIVTNVWNNSDKKVNNLALINKDIILAYIRDENYQPNWKEDTKLNKIVTDGQPYFELLALVGEKMLVSQSDKDRADSCVSTLKTHPFTSKYFNDNPFDSHIEAHFQVKFITTFTMQGKTYHIRCMLDRIIVDHKNKTIEPIDLKTTGKPEEEFENSFLAWRYDLQATMYSFILMDLCKKDPYFKDFTILPFKFICINRFNQKPLIWTYEDSLKHGERVSTTGDTYKSWYKLLQELIWHLETGMQDYSYKSYQCKGERVLSNLLLKTKNE